jgi:hypothetical protein
MEKSRLISTIKKLYKPNFSNLGPTDIYTYFVSTFPYNELSKAMSSEDVIMASFLLPMVNTPEVLDKQYDFIKFNLFGFTLVEIDSEYSEITCDICNGDGYEVCDECGGEGTIDCDECGGDGEDVEGDSCGACGGEGKERCDYCEHDGTVTCNECGGSGSWDDSDKSDVSQWFFVSYDKRLLDDFIALEEWDEVKNEIMISKKAISLLRKQEVIDKPNENIESGDLYFYEVTEEPKFMKTSNNRIDISNLTDVG